MSVFDKLQTVRDTIREAKIQKTGKGQGRNGNWSFYETEDFWPTAVKLFAEHKLFTFTSSTGELATMTIIDLEEPEFSAERRICFTAPFSPAKDSGLHPCQNQGWGLSYIYRRLYLNALELNEKDPVDGGEKILQRESGADKFMEEEPQEVSNGTV